MAVLSASPRIQSEKWTGVPTYDAYAPAALDADHFYETETGGPSLYRVTDNSIAFLDYYDLSADGYVSWSPDFRFGFGMGNDEGYCVLSLNGGTAEAVAVIGRIGDALDVSIYPGNEVDTTVAYPLGDSSGYVTNSQDPTFTYSVFRGYSTSGVEQWQYDAVDVPPGTSGPYKAAYFPRSERITLFDTAGSAVELRNSTGGTVDTIAWDYDGSLLYEYHACGRDRVVVVGYDYTGTPSLSYRVLDTSGDALTWLDTTRTAVTGGMAAGYHSSKTWQGLLTLSALDGYPVVWVNPVTHAVTTSAVPTVATTWKVPVGWYRTVGAPQATDGPMLLMSMPSQSTLRQRQSPRRTPSRVRPPQLRQRQRPEVT